MSVHAAGTQYDKLVGSQYGFPNAASKSPVVTPYFFDRTLQNDVVRLAKDLAFISAIWII